MKEAINLKKKKKLRQNLLMQEEDYFILLVCQGSACVFIEEPLRQLFKVTQSLVRPLEGSKMFKCSLSVCNGAEERDGPT